MRGRRPGRSRRERGAAAVEYALMLMVLVLGIGVGLDEFEDGVESDAVQTANDISGDPGEGGDSSTSSAPTTTTGITTSTLPPPPVNQPPLVDVPDETMVHVDPTESNPFTIRTLISDDYTPVDLMAITISWTSGLNGDGAYTVDDVNSPAEWIEHVHTAPKPGVYYVTVCAHDGLEEACDTGIVKVSTGDVHVDTHLYAYDYTWNGSNWQWRYRVRLRIYDSGVPAHIVNYDDVTVDYDVSAVYDDGSGPVVVAESRTCVTSNGYCYWYSGYMPADAISVTVSVTDVYGLCVDGWDGDPSTLSLSDPLGAGPGSPPTTTTTTTTIPTTTIPSSSSSTVSTTTTTPTTTASTTTTTTIITTTTFDDDT